MSRGTTVAVVGALVAAAFGAGRLAGTARREPPSEPLVATAPATTTSPKPTRGEQHAAAAETEQLRRERDEARAELAAARAKAAETRPDAADLLAKRLGEPLDAAAQSAAKDRADRMRADLLAATDKVEATVAALMEQEIRKERAERDDRLRGGTMAFLKGLKQRWVPQSELVRSAEKFGALFERKSNGLIVDASQLDYAIPPADGTTLRFPAGRSRLLVSRMNQWRPFPKDLVVQGAGMDATLLVADADLAPREDVHCLTLCDLTFFGHDAVADIGHDAAWTLAIDRCRILGFDCGAGGSVMAYGDAGALRAQGSRFEGGFGRSPGYANLLRGDGVLARFENCVFVGPFNDLGSDSGQSVVFQTCRFEALPGSAEEVSRYGSGRDFVDCTFERVDALVWRSAKQRPLADLNPAWTEAKNR